MQHFLEFTKRFAEGLGVKISGCNINKYDTLISDRTVVTDFSGADSAGAIIKYSKGVAYLHGLILI